MIFFTSIGVGGRETNHRTCHVRVYWNGTGDSGRNVFTCKSKLIRWRLALYSKTWLKEGGRYYTWFLGSRKGEGVGGIKGTFVPHRTTPISRGRICAWRKLGSARNIGILYNMWLFGPGRTIKWVDNTDISWLLVGEDKVGIDGPNRCKLNRWRTYGHR